MTRRDRTTGLPGARRGARAAGRASEGGGLFSRRLARFGIIGTAIATLIVVAGLIAFFWYDSAIGQPGKTVLRVGAEEFSLSYYAARLPEFARTDPSGRGLLVTEALLNRLEQEGLVLAAAAERGIDLSDDDVTAAIAIELGVPADTSRGSLFDTRYREALRESGLSDGHYRRQTRARATERELRTALREDVGESGAIVHLRVVTTATLEEAEAIVARIEEGEDMGTIAQVDSLHNASRQNDGILLSPPSLLEEPLRNALTSAEAGELLDPVESGGIFWVIRLEERDAEGSYTDADIARLTELRFEEAIETARSRVTIERDFTTDDANWAIEQAG
jgi:parvulin-like peptidyl-prolyl isomerase